MMQEVNDFVEKQWRQEDLNLQAFPKFLRSLTPNKPDLVLDYKDR
jgi:hypothetical protein